VWPFGIEFCEEVIEAGLLLKAIWAHRFIASIDFGLISSIDSGLISSSRSGPIRAPVPVNPSGVMWMSGTDAAVHRWVTCESLWPLPFSTRGERSNATSEITHAQDP
jgi:hypothetical protein